MPRTNNNTTLFASESVAAGHPDKIADQISDAILDALLAQDPHSRTAIEVLVGAGQVTLAGEITSTAAVKFADIARSQIRRLGYTNPQWGFHDGAEVRDYIHQQSPEISIGVEEYGAGDQGMMFGYACSETEQLLPLPIVLAHALTRRLDQVREEGVIGYLRPDGKAQVVVEYQDGRPSGIRHVTIATAHDESVSHDEVKQDVHEHIVSPVLKEYGYAISPKQLIVNGTGIWYIPGPYTDAGLTGRKIVVDGYGGFARVGGGAFSGKDPSKVDRSGAYAARYLAKNIVAAGLAERAEVAVAYYIGAKEPVMTTIEMFGTGTKPQADIEAYARELLVPSVKNIIETLGLKQPIYLPTAAYGHFGRKDVPWERVVGAA
ncbi:methionine adenosyltransferase [Candidatus Saccharibacteria bacterium]|nr:methionine adenosyltransferase [Candidatus Saccharibacteria bacterium]